MPRYTTNMAMTAKIESTAGTDAAPVAGTDGVLLIKGVDITPLDVKYAERNILQPFFGGSQSLIANYNTKVAFDVELAGGGAAALTTVGAPWGVLLRACATSQAALVTPNRIEHTPASTGLSTVTIYLYDDGVLHKLIGSMGSVKLMAKQGETPKLHFEFIGTYAAVTAVALPSPVLTAWKVPTPVSKANVIDITLGCTYATGAISGGTVFASNGLEIDFGNALQWFASLSSERADITDRDAKVRFDMELTAAQEVTAFTDIIANTVTGLGFTLSGAAGSKIIIFAPALQRTSIKKSEENGVRLVSFEGKLLPSAGNDDVRIVQL